MASRSTSRLLATVAQVRGRGLFSFSGASALRSLPVAAQGRFFSSGGSKVLSLGVLGFGNVGGELVDQVTKASKKIESDFGVKLEVTGIARSKEMLLLPSGSSTLSGNFNWKDQKVDPVDLSKFVDHVKKAGDRSVIVDNTAADEPAEHYADWINAGMSVVTPNKKAGSGPMNRYRNIQAAQKKTGARFLGEATVGAGLPIVRMTQELRDTGDEVEKVEGIFSGTLSYIFNTWKPGGKFSEVVDDAKGKGFTEPDPRDDLSGTDVQRKVTILARELGLELELSDIPVNSLVPEKLQNWEPPAGKNLGEAFVEELKSFDGEMDSLISEAEKAGEVLRYVGTVDLKAKKASVKLGRFPKTHPFAATQFADNIVAFNTKRYTPRPLVVQGPGAGAAVTAGGIFGDILTVVHGMSSSR